MSLIEIFKVTVNHFRGYREEKIFDFENGAEVILLAGPNGYGKTSVFDAIEWGFTGKLSRFEEPNEEKNNSCFINFQPFERNGEVYIEFGNRDSRYYLTRKSTYLLSDSTDYSSKKSNLCITGTNIDVLYNDKAVEFLNKLLIKDEWRDKIDFTEIFSRYHVLTQDKIKKFIQGLKGPDRYKQISMMVGTQRFYLYKNFFEKYAKVFKDNAKEIADKKNKLQIEISSTKELIHNDIKINIGNCKTIEEWIDYLVKRYNEITVQFDIEKYNAKKELNILEIVIDLKGDIIQTQEKLRNIKNKNITIKDNLLDIKYNLKEYKDSKSKFELYNSIIPIADKRYKLLRLQKQIPLFKEYSEIKKKNDINTLQDSNLLKQTEIYLLKFTTLYNQIDFILNEVNIEKRHEDSLEKLLSNEIKLLNSNIPKFDDINEVIIDKKSISFLEYKQLADIDIDIEETLNLNDFIKNNINFYRNNINEILINCLGFEESVSKLRNKILELNNDIKNLSKLEKELKDILTESLSYIKKDITDNDGQVKCPVCNSNFNKDRFIENVEKKLINDNQELSLKIKDKEELEKQLKEYQNKLTKSKERYKQYNIEFINKINNIKNAIILLGQTIRKQEKKYTDELKNLNEENMRIQEKQSNILSLIHSLNLIDDVNELEKKLKLELESINANLQERGVDIVSLETGDLQSIIKNCKQKIASFEETLKQFKIDIINIEDDIESKVVDVNNKNLSLDSCENNLKYIEESFSEAHKELANSDRIKALKVLEEQYKELSTEEKNNIKNAEGLEKLVESSTEAIQEISQDILIQHQEFINTIYKRINPHPLFTEIEFNFDKNNKGTDILNISCVNKNFNNKVNPAFTFSSAQVNVVAVSIFLGMALRQQCSNLKTILLDDPIQNMDDLNVISFIDILRNCLSINKTETNNKQIIISTHDQDFYKIMIKKFRFVKNKSFEFISYSNQGPEVM